MNDHDPDDLSPDDAELELLRRSEPNKILFELFRKLAGAGELIEEFLAEHGEGHGCYFCSCGKPDLGRIIELLFGLRWALGLAATDLEDVVLVVQLEEKKPAHAPLLHLTPFTTDSPAPMRAAL